MNTGHCELGLIFLSIGSLVGCGAIPDGSAGEGGETTAESAEAVINGTPVNSSDYPGVVAVYNLYRPGGGLCTGSLIHREWVLTARHCVTLNGMAQGELVGLPQQLKVIRATSPGASPPPASANPSQGVTVIADAKLQTSQFFTDLALIKITPGISNPTLLWNGSTNGQLANSTVRAVGYGVNTTTTGSGTLRMADVPVIGDTSGDTFATGMSASGQRPSSSDSGCPLLKTVDVLGRSVKAVAGVHNLGNPTSGSNTGVAAWRSWIRRRVFVPGNVNVGGTTADIALTGPAGWGSIPVAFTGFNEDTGVSFTITNFAVPSFPVWASTAGAKALSGDFNGDGRSDLALTGVAGWNTIPVAASDGGGTYTVTAPLVPTIPALAATANVKAVPGDFDGDGYDDIALTGASGWTDIKIALSTGGGNFSSTSSLLSNTLFATWSGTAGVKVLAGDFDGDGRDDIALTGPSGWLSMPVAFSNGLGSFYVTNYNVSSFPALAATANAKAVTGDFNKDGRDDVALTGANWTTIPIALSNGNGSFTFYNATAEGFPSVATTQNARPVAGDFNGDGRDDIALVGGAGWTSIPVAVMNTSGNFRFFNPAVANFPTYGSQGGIPLANHLAR